MNVENISHPFNRSVHNPLKVPAALVPSPGPAINGLTYFGESLTYTTEELTYAG